MKASNAGDDTTRQFFYMAPPFRGGNHGLEIQNLDRLLPPGRVMLSAEKPHGLPLLPERPILRPPVGKGRLLKDLVKIDGFWLVSARLKRVLEEVDPNAVEFAECDLFHSNGKPYEEPHYLCAVIREIDAIDLENSVVKMREVLGSTLYDMVGSHDIRFNTNAVGDIHIFRQKQLPAVIADSVLREKCIAAGITDQELFQSLSNIKRHRSRS